MNYMSPPYQRKRRHETSARETSRSNGFLIAKPYYASWTAAASLFWKSLQQLKPSISHRTSPLMPSGISRRIYGTCYTCTAKANAHSPAKAKFKRPQLTKEKKKAPLVT